MIRNLQLKIVFFTILISLIPSTLFSIYLYRSFENIKSKDDEKYLTIMKNQIRRKIKGKYSTVNKIINFYSTVKSKINKKEIKKLIEILQKIQGISGYLVLNRNNEKVYNYGYTIDKSYLNLKEINKRLEHSDYSYFNYISKIEKIYQYSVFKLKNSKMIVILFFTPNFFKEIVDKYSDIEIEIFNSNFELISTSNFEKLFTVKLNRITKDAVSGYNKTYTINNIKYSYGYIDIKDNPIFITLFSKSFGYFHKSNSYKVYIVMFNLFSIVIAFILSFKLTKYIKEFIDLKKVSNEYENFEIKKFIKDLDYNIITVDNVLKTYTDFQVLKEDIEKLKDRFNNLNDKKFKQEESNKKINKDGYVNLEKKISVNKMKKVHKRDERIEIL